MALYIRLLAGVMLAYLTIALSPLQADAQGTKVVVVNQARVVAESTAGQDMQRKVQAIGQSMASELESEANALETEGRALQSRTANLSQEAIAADTELRGLIESYARKQQALAVKQQKSRQELAMTEQNALNAFGQALQPVLDEVVRERSADIMVDRAVVAFAAPTVDVTDLVLSKINARTQTITVTRARIPDQQAAPATISQ